MAIDDETLKTETAGEGRASAFLIGIQDADSSHASALEYLAELGELVNTLGIPVAGEKAVSVRQVNPKFYVGSGKIRELMRQKGVGDSRIVIDNFAYSSARGAFEESKWHFDHFLHSLLADV